MWQAPLQALGIYAKDTRGEPSAQQAVKRAAMAVSRQMSIVTPCPVFRAALPWSSNHFVNCSFHNQIYVYRNPHCQDGK